MRRDFTRCSFEVSSRVVDLDLRAVDADLGLQLDAGLCWGDIGKLTKARDGSARLESAVVVDSQLRGVEARRAVAFECTCRDLEFERGAFAFRAVGQGIHVPADHVLTTLPVDATDLERGLEYLVWDSQRDPGAKESYEQPQAPNRLSFAEKFSQMRQRDVMPDAIEAEIESRFRAPLRRN